MDRKDIHIIQVPIEIFVQLAPTMIAHLVETLYRISDVAKIQKNVAIEDIISESSKYVEELLVSFTDAMKDIQDEKDNNIEGT